MYDYHIAASINTLAHVCVCVSVGVFVWCARACACVRPREYIGECGCKN